MRLTGNILTATYMMFCYCRESDILHTKTYKNQFIFDLVVQKIVCGEAGIFSEIHCRYCQ